MIAATNPIDILLRGSPEHGYELLDAVTHVVVAGPVVDLAEAIAVARANRARTIWHQQIDNRGRILGDPVPLTKPREWPAGTVSTS